MHVSSAQNMHGLPQRHRRFAFESGTIGCPVNKQWPDQRDDERQQNGPTNRKIQTIQDPAPPGNKRTKTGSNNLTEVKPSGAPFGIWKSQKYALQYNRSLIRDPTDQTGNAKLKSMDAYRPADFMTRPFIPLVSLKNSLLPNSTCTAV